MRLRSLLFVPGDRPERMEKALSSGADAVILDLEDSVSLERKQAARMAVAAFLAQAGRTVPLFVRINPLNGKMADTDLAAVVGEHPTGIVLPKAEGPASLVDLDRRLTELGDHEATILPIATETPAGMFRLGEYGGVTSRLVGLTWGAEDLPAAVGGISSREEDGRFTPPYEIARALTLFGAAAAEVAPIETVYPAFRDIDGLRTYAARGARDGFVGMMAIHPSQVGAINEAFTPTAESVAHARAVVAAFEANPDAGALALNGTMIDAPHLKQAQRILARAKAYA